MTRRILLLAIGMIVFATPALADPVVTGRFIYEDRVWDKDGYTGAIANLPIRYADVEVVRQSNGAILGTGSTDAGGNYSIDIAQGPSFSENVYVRVLSSTDLHGDYHIKVVDTFVRSGGTVDLSGSTVFAVTTGAQLVETSDAGTWGFGVTVIQDLTGSGVAQAYNILDNAVDGFDYLASASGIGRFPLASEFVVFGWNGTAGSSGSNYFWQGIFIASTPSDTDGWADTVILHEMGHWATDMFSEADNPGGSHFIGDNFQDPRLSYGEGYATFYCAQVREFVGAPSLSIYADMAIPALPPAAGNLEFAYDFETGLFNTGAPIGQLGSANETNVTSAMWDVVDGTAGNDATPGVDDDIQDDTGALSWAVLENQLTVEPSPLTVEDFYQGWFSEHGAGFQQTEMESSFVGLAGMPFHLDPQEPDGTIGTATTPCLAYTNAGAGVVINECDMGPEDKIELYNAGTTAVDLTGWVLKADRNGFATASYTFPSFILYPGTFVVVHESGNPANNNSVHLYGGGGFSVVWFNTDDGACTLEDNFATPVDFVRWDNVSGSDPNSTPVPGGLTFTGTLFSSPAGTNLSRDANGLDTDDAGDFTAIPASMGAPNFNNSTYHTIYPEGDQDVICVPLLAGELVVVQASSPHSAGEPLIEILSQSGVPSGTVTNTFGITTLAEVQFVAPADTTVYFRINNDAPYTDFAPMDVLVYKRPDAAILSPPSAVVVDPENMTDVLDVVDLSWFNGGTYDNVEVFRDGSLIATLPGGNTSYQDQANRGLYEYSVRGVIGGSPSLSAAAPGFAGLIDCSLEEDFESGAGELLLDSPWALQSSVVEAGTFALHDSPVGDYGNDLDISAEILPPMDVVNSPILEFDHICLTEATYDFGFLEISTNFGGSWSQLAVYDMDDHAGWNDGVANPGDWVHESIDLSSYAGEKIRLRFRLVTDSFVVEDGWYIDNVAFSDSTCGAILAGPEDFQPTVTGQLSAFPNPFRGQLQLALDVEPGTVADIQVFDLQGRLVRDLHTGPLGGDVVVRWDGLNDAGRTARTGVYFIRARGQDVSAVRRVLKLN